MIRRLNLKALKSQGKYKNKSTYLDAVYRANKKLIDEHIEQPTNPNISKKTVFKQLVKEQEAEGMTTRQAVKTLSRSTVFTSTKERLQYNAYEAVRGDLDAYKEFRELTKVKGKYQKIEMDKFVWDQDEHAYIYDERVKISFSNSPKETIVEIIDED